MLRVVRGEKLFQVDDAQSVNELYISTLTMIEFVNSQFTESQVEFSAAIEQLATTLSSL